MTFNTPLWSHDPRAHTPSWHQRRAAWSEARETGFGVLLDMKNFFFFLVRNRNIKQAASTPPTPHPRESGAKSFHP